MPIEPTADQRGTNITPWAYTDAVLAPPAGWIWNTRPMWYGTRDVDAGTIRPFTVRRTIDTFEQDVQRLFAWAREHDIRIEVGNRRTIAAGDVEYHVPNRWSVHPMVPFGEPMVMCPHCDGEVPPAAKCALCEEMLACESCRSLYSDNTLVMTESGVGCTNCTNVCRNCPTVIPSGHRRCQAHGQHFTCHACQNLFEQGLTRQRTIDGNIFCATCAARVCSVCSTLDPNVPMVEEYNSTGIHNRICLPCKEERDKGRTESKDDVSPMTAEEWLFEAMPDRPSRVISIEQEFEAYSPETGGYRQDSVCGNLLARKLYDKGLSPYPSIAAYHSSGHHLPAHVETDASVPTGGELILQQLDLSVEEDSANMESILSSVQELVAEDKIRFTARCGTHIHVDLHGYDLHDARNLVTIYSYLEDLIYRLGSAGYEDHRVVMVDNDYALPVRKDKWGDVVKFGREFLRRADHTDSLNMQHFYTSMSRCKCGAVEFGNMKDCECVRRKCTAEWRVFNGTGDARKLHAYLAIVQAITAWCQDRELDVEEYEDMEFNPGLDFSGSLTFKHYKHMDKWVGRLEWMLRNLPFTDAERESLFYAIERSPVRHLGDTVLNRLREVERVPEDRTVEYVKRVSRENSGPDLVEEPDFCRNCGDSFDYCNC